MTTPFPKVNSQQAAENSILDLFNKQTYLGNSFILPTPAVTLADTTETPVALIRNPSTSTKSIFMFNKKIATDPSGNSINVRFYGNPTVNVAGSATIPLNLRSGYSTQSISNCNLTPTLTSNGTFLAILPAIVLQISSSLLNVIDPGDSLLVTAQQVGAGTATLYFELAWYEI